MMPAKTDPREPTAPTRYYYRRSLDAGDLLPAIGVAVAAGLAGFYLAQLFLQRTPLTVEGIEPTRRRKKLRRARKT